MCISIERLSNIFSSLIFSTSFISVTKANGHLSILIGWITSSWILIVFLWLIVSFFIHLIWMNNHVGTVHFIWSIFSFYTNCISCSFHSFVNTLVQIDMALIYRQVFSVIDFSKRFIITLIWSNIWSFSKIRSWWLIKII